MQECPLAFEDTVHERAHGFCDRQHNAEENQYLRNTDPSHFSTSKLLWTKQRVHQINEQGRRDDSRNGIFHGILLKALRRLCKSPEQNEEGNDDSHIENIQQHNHLAKIGCMEPVRALDSIRITRWPLARSASAIRLCAVGHQRFRPPITTTEFGLRACKRAGA
jgi:hypothetical protein